MNFIILTFALKLAFVPIQTNLLYATDFSFERCRIKDYSYVEVNTNIEIWETFFISGKINIPILFVKDEISFYPFALGSTFSAGMKKNIFELGFTHYCIHPVIPSFFMNHSIQYEGSHSEFYLEIKGHL